MKKLKTLFKVLGVLLAIYLLWNILHQTQADLLQSLKSSAKPYILVAFLCYGGVCCLGAWRWGRLLGVQGINLTFWELFRLTMIGMFFSGVIPGSVSGDLVKIGYIMKYAMSRKTEAVLTIALDRIIGLAGLFIVAAISTVVMLFAYPEIFMKTAIIKYCSLFICFAGLCYGIVVALILLKDRIMAYESVRWCVLIGARVLPAKLTETISRVVSAIELYKVFPRAIAENVIVSICVHSLLATQNFLLGRAFHEETMSFIQYTIVTQIGNVTGILPLTPGGIGIRESVEAMLFKQFNVTSLDVMSLIPIFYTLITLLWALVGAVIFVCTKDEQK